MDKERAKTDKKKTSGATTPAPAPQPQSGDGEAEEKPFDFGGLPDRDLKRNLGGCG